MKLLHLFALCGTLVAGKKNQCEKTPKGGIRRYQPPRTIERGDNNPASIEFLLDNRADLLNIFAAGSNPELEADISAKMGQLNTFQHSVGDQFMGQVFRVTRQIVVNMVAEGEFTVHKAFGEKMAKDFRDNSQRVTRALRDILYSQTALYKIANNEDFSEDLIAINEKDFSEGTKVQEAFYKTHLANFIPVFKLFTTKFVDLHKDLALQLSKVIADEKQKSSYRRVINELPQVYQFINDNIDYVQMNNMDKDLEEAVAADILRVMAEQEGNTQIVSMLNRHKKFIKKVMVERSMQQQKEKAVKKVTEKNAELKQAADNEEEFNRLLEQAKKDGQDITDAMRKQIWAQVIANQKDLQKDEISNQQKDGKKGNTLSRYQHMVALLGLMPDELKETLALMVKEQCPELNLLQIETEEMKTILNEQPANFVDQLIQELHDVCDMFGLIDPNKVTTQVINGVEVDFYAADWHSGDKVEWN